jgi:single-stranded-DNA-specific exonuclease
MYTKLTLQALDRLLKARFKEGFLSLKDLPHPHTFKDMQKATDRIVSAIAQKEKIVIIGDYDVDGVTATTLLKLFFDEIGTSVEWIIPNRFKDGYGLSETIIPRIEGYDLAITVDNGISAVKAAQLCKEKGIDLIITDHHLLPPELPEAYAIIDQKQPECTFPYEEVCGAQIVWYLIASLKNALQIRIDMMAYMELAAIAVIADMMPLQHINRAMVISGLKSLSKSQRPAVKAYMEHTQKESLNAEDIGFFLAPLLNSAGRMDDAKYAVEFLLSSNIYDARVRLQRLIDFNEARKATEAKITREALETVDGREKVVVVCGKTWHEGVVGIVASRVAKACKRPCIVLSDNGEGMLKGSGRSFGKCDLFATINPARPLLEKFGGHAAAVGLSLSKERFSAFKTQLQCEFEVFKEAAESMEDEIVGELAFHDISFELTALIRQFEPYGQGNPQPKFITKNVEILQADPMGKEGNHLRFLFRHAGVVHQGVQFKTDKVYATEQYADLVYTVNENHFRGNVTLQLMVEEIKIYENNLHKL